MKLVRFLYEGGERFGNLEKDTVRLLEGSISGGFTSTDQMVALDSVRLLSPVKPTKAVCMGLNYMDHIQETNAKTPTEPVVFIKPSTTVTGPDSGIYYPKQTKRLDYEGELAIVIGKRAKNVREEEVDEFILGYTCANDVTARDLQPPDGQWTIAKGFDSFLPLGPCINTELDPSALSICTRLNGKVVQSSNTVHLLFKPRWIVSYLSSIMTLEPEDVILTGTPSGISPMQIGDAVSVEIEGIGTLTNHICGEADKL